MPKYPRPKSSMTRKSSKSSLHPHGAPTFSETLEGLKEGLAQLGSHLVGAGAGIAGNLIGTLTNLRQSGQEGDEDSEKAYLEAVSMLRNSGSSSADSLLKELGEELGEEEGNDEASQSNQESETVANDLDQTQTPAETPEDAPAETVPTDTPQRSTHDGKVTCLECGGKLKKVTNTHLATHGMSPQEYKKKYGLASGKGEGEAGKRAA